MISLLGSLLDFGSSLIGPVLEADMAVIVATHTERALVDLSSDLGFICEPLRMLEFQNLLHIRRPFHAVIASAHPLAKHQPVRLRECLKYPVALPTANFGVRHLLETAVRRTSLTLDPVVVSDSFEFLSSHAVAENIVTF